MQMNLFDKPEKKGVIVTQGIIKPEELFEAYYLCRKNKRNTHNALAFEMDYEKNLVELCDEINKGNYRPRRSITFIVDKPVLREIFAAEFRDRVVHHLLIKKLNPLFEKEFINDSYACRTGKGTHFGISRVDSFIRKCSENYKKDCFILKLDVSGFFMHINRDILYERLSKFINDKYHDADKQIVLALCKIVIFNDPTKNCFIKGKKHDWENLPDNKSLFNSPVNSGLPIGNLTSQIFANFYMNSFDHYIKSKLGTRYYGRYVDDFIIVHKEKDYLTSLIPVIKEYLNADLQLTLHPNKIYLEHYRKGVQFLGVVIKPGRTYIASRTAGNFKAAIEKQNNIARMGKPSITQQSTFLSTMNSYLGIMKHYNTYWVRKEMIYDNVCAWWWNLTYLNASALKFVMKIKVIKKNRQLHNVMPNPTYRQEYIYQLYCRSVSKFENADCHFQVNKTTT
jgi:RNA-directed DNA polymerase